MIIRRTTPDDEAALTQLAELDSKQPLDGDYLVAMVDGRFRAAVSLSGDQVMGDPFEPTADLIAMLEMRAAQLGEPTVPRPSLRSRLLPARSATADA
jgi:hypothetical protein